MGGNFFFDHLGAKKSFIPTSVLGMSGAGDFLPETYFLTILGALNPGLKYFANNSIIKPACLDCEQSLVLQLNTYTTALTKVPQL